MYAAKTNQKCPPLCHKGLQSLFQVATHCLPGILLLFQSDLPETKSSPVQERHFDIKSLWQAASQDRVCPGKVLATASSSSEQTLLDLQTLAARRTRNVLLANHHPGNAACWKENTTRLASICKQWPVSVCMEVSFGVLVESFHNTDQEFLTESFFPNSVSPSRWCLPL